MIVVYGYMMMLYRILLFLLVVFPLGMLHGNTRGISVDIRTHEAVDAPIHSKVQLYAKSYALVIGIDDYDDWSSLDEAVNDARKVAKALKQQGFTVITKLNLEDDELDEALENFLLDYGQDADARLFIWYAGHGHTLNGLGYLVPSNAPLPGRDETAFIRKAFPMQRIDEYVRVAKAKHVLAVFDSCFSGTIFDDARSNPPPVITRVTTKPVRQFITSGSAGQTVSDNGEFADLFIDAISGARNADYGGDGYLTGSELGMYMEDKISNYTNNSQTPKYGKLKDPKYDQGDFVFTLPQSSRQSIGVDVAGGSGVDGSLVQADSNWWNSIKDKSDIKLFELYLKKFPNGQYKELAEYQLKQLRAGDKTPDTSSQTSLDYRVTTSDRIGYVPIGKRVNVRSGPGTGYDKVGVLSSSSKFYIVGEVSSSQWVKIEYGNGSQGFIYEPLTTSIDPAIAEAERKAKEEAALKARARALVGEMVEISRGSFKMGFNSSDIEWGLSNGSKEEWENWSTPLHKVRFDYDFSIGKYEVTLGQFKQFVSSTGYDMGNRCITYEDGEWDWRDNVSYLNPVFSQSDTSPVVCVSWDDAISYIDWVNKELGLRDSLYRYRLASESEWEFAARGGSSTRFYWGDSDDGASRYAWYGKNSGGKTHAVGQKEPNNYGLYDMSGNVWEWVSDCWNESYSGAPSDGSSWEDGNCKRRVLRGGSWSGLSNLIRSALRSRYYTDYRFINVGFRLLRTLP